MCCRKILAEAIYMDVIRKGGHGNLALVKNLKFLKTMISLQPTLKVTICPRKNITDVWPKVKSLVIMVQS